MLIILFVILIIIFISLFKNKVAKSFKFRSEKNGQFYLNVSLTIINTNITRSVSANDMFVQFNAWRKGTTIRINKAERMESLKIRLIPQFKRTLIGNTVTK